MKKVGINLLWMVPGVVGGSETYLTRLLSGLAERSTAFDYTIFALPQFADAHPDLARTFKIAFAPVTGQFKSFRVAGENSWLAAQCRRRNIDLVHHAGGIVPLVRTARPVLTIHDLQYLYYPEYFTQAKLAYLKKMVPRSAEAARLILTPSEYTRRTVIERLNIDPQIVIVVPHGISPRDRRSDGAEMRGKYGLEGRFFLYPAITYPHKNHLVLVEGLAKLVERHPDAMLVLTGGKGSFETRLAAEIKSLGIEKHIRRLGYIPADDLDALYNEAVAMCFPSRFEGFGAPVLEAMARGCPVIASDATALPEVVQDAGSLVSPDNADQWAQAMAELLEDETRRNELSAGGLERAKEFTWTSSADILEDAYLHALETTL
ncbi:MAG TPA: glycosyltransferase family 1 protein [Actinomycetota bacterium]|nr:glycosyltransferase family 1 protein [Actinomycetota bacterium]